MGKVIPQHIDMWHEDIGPCLWWKFPVTEPPYSGTPLDDDWPGYHTHFTRVEVPDPPIGTKDVVAIIRTARGNICLRSRMDTRMLHGIVGLSATVSNWAPRDVHDVVWGATREHDTDKLRGNVTYVPHDELQKIAGRLPKVRRG